MAVEVSSRVEFECCYLLGTELNAHRYRLEVVVDGPQREADNGTVIEFSVLRKYLKSVVFDKTFLFDTTCDNIGKDVALTLGLNGVLIAGVGFAITAENLCKHFVKSLQDIFDTYEPGVTVVEAKLRENSDSFASWSLR